MSDWSVASCSGQRASGLYAAHAAFTAASASAPSTSTRAIVEPGSGGVSRVTEPRVAIDQPPGAMKVLPPTVARGVSAGRVSGGWVAAAAGSGGVALLEVVVEVLVFEADEPHPR